MVCLSGKILQLSPRAEFAFALGASPAIMKDLGLHSAGVAEWGRDNEAAVVGNLNAEISFIIRGQEYLNYASIQILF